MANNRIQVKRTSTSGRTPNTTNSGNLQFIDAGEFALNMPDQILYTSNGTALITVGSNQSSLYVTSQINVASAMLANSLGVFPTSNTILLGNTTNRWTINARDVNVTGAFTGGTYNGTTGTFSSTMNFNATTVNVNAVQFTTGSLNLGGVLQTGSILVGQSTNNQTLEIANGATVSGNVKTITIGMNGLSGSQTNITIGTPLSNTSVLVNANNFLINNDSATFRVGNATVNTVITSTSVTTANIALTTNVFTVGTASYFVSNGNLGISTSSPGYRLEVNGSFAATTKSFVINHPTKEDMKLRYGSLEGPENGVYIRGRSNNKVIDLPDYWIGLVDENSITVSITAIGKKQELYVKSISNNIVTIGGSRTLDFFYTVFAERKDVEKLVVEF